MPAHWTRALRCPGARARAALVSLRTTPRAACPVRTGIYAPRSMWTPPERSPWWTWPAGSGVAIRSDAGRSCASAARSMRTGYPSLRIHADGRRWYCYPCGKGGDAIRLYMRARRLNFINAVRELAA